VYCDMAGSEGFVTSWPLFSPRHKDERLYVTATRLPELLGQLDVNFANATIQGLSRAIPIATMTGKLLAALGLPIPAVFDLLRHPERWRGKITQLADTHPEVTTAVEDFGDYLALSRRIREERTEPFLNRLNLLRHDEVSRALFGSTREPTIDLDRVSRTGQTVLCDFSREYSQFARQFKLLAVFNMLLEHIAHRGRGVPPLSVVIDELSFFVRGAAHTNTSVIAEQFRQMIEQRMRNNNIYLTLATQDLKQIPLEMLSACLNLKSLLIGAQSDPETAQYLAERFIEHDPMRVKYWERVWASEQLNGLTRHFVIDHRPVFSPLEEQRYTAHRVFMTLPKGTWLFAESAGEGEVATAVRPITTQHLFAGPFPSEHAYLIQKLRSYLTRQVGMPLAEALAEIEEQVVSQQISGTPGTKQPQHVRPVPAGVDGPIDAATASHNGSPPHAMAGFGRREG